METYYIQTGDNTRIEATLTEGGVELEKQEYHEEEEGNITWGYWSSTQQGHKTTEEPE